MCTAITYKTKDHYFGRTLDYEKSFGESVVIVPRNFVFSFRKMPKMPRHYAMIGMAAVVCEYPLFYEATNEKGLSMAGLNFPGNADYKSQNMDLDNIAPFEFIPWILSQCATVEEAVILLKRINMVNIHFSDDLKLSPLHWIMADQKRCMVIESVKDGLKFYENPIGVLTNNPTFDMQMFNLNNYMHLSNEAPKNTFLKNRNLDIYSLGMGALGLPGDFSSVSRFVKAAFVREHSVSGKTESESISQFFHILESVSQPRGSVDIGNGEYEKTIYTSCCNVDQGIYYYTTYENHQITAVRMDTEDLEGHQLYVFPLIQSQQIFEQNRKIQGH